MTRFKICGLREAKHALVAADAGADFLGFVFVPDVRRQLSEQQGKDIVRDYRRLKASRNPRLVGLFANQPLEDVNRIVRSCGLNMAQLCGDEPPACWEGVAVPVIKQIKVHEYHPMDEVTSDVLRRVDQVVSRGHLAMLDKYEAGSLGGTGRTFDWSIARDVAKHHDFFLAGGLSPENVAGAITMVNPWCVDISTGVETDGVKDVDKIIALAKQVHCAGGRTTKSPHVNTHEVD